MPKTSLSKFWVFVILTISVGLMSISCFLDTGTPLAPKSSAYGSVVKLGSIADPEIIESSGVVASRCDPDILWTHNDSGDDAFIYAMRKDGAKAGTWKIPNAQNIDWEDIATRKDKDGTCFLYIAEIGDNSAKRDSYAVYKVREPKVATEDASSFKANPRISENPEVLGFTYPDGRHNAETLLVHPVSGEMYIVTKRVSGPSAVYKLKPNFRQDGNAIAEKVADVAFPAVPNGFVTGGDISPDGTRVAICDYSAAYEFVLPSGTSNFDAIWSAAIETIDVGSRKVGEAISYTPDGKALILTSEGKGSPIIEVVRTQ